MSNCAAVMCEMWEVGDVCEVMCVRLVMGECGEGLT